MNVFGNIVTPLNVKASKFFLLKLSIKLEDDDNNKKNSFYEF